TPTIHPYFAGDGAVETAVPTPSGPYTPTISALFAFVPSPTPRPLPTRRPTSTPTMTPPPSPTPPPDETPQAEATAAPLAIAALPEDGRFNEIIIYDDELDPNWTLGESWGITYTLTETAVVYSGDVAASVTPLAEFGAVFFTVAPGALQEYLREDVLGVSLWLNSGDDYLPLDEMAVTILGSNATPYWTEDDDSVEQAEGESFFSETRLYYLGLNAEIPPNTWVEVIIWLDQLPYDPDYVYITGIYVKNGDVFQGTYYVDRVALLMGGES
ncbi:MAG: hypothetical protein KC415_15940, partial [Anaerolineales bacterium]|nr:hypothetical protein [Anaerolineales bacterium]